MREPSGSKLALAAACQHPWTSGIRWPADHDSMWSAFGHRVHEACEALVTGAAVYPAVYRGLGEAEVRTLHRCVGHARALLAATPAQDQTLVELSIRYDVATGKARVADRFDSRVAGEWTSIVDYLGVRAGEVLVRDWKTGRQQHTEPARANLQVRLGAVAAARAFGVRRARVELVYLDADDYEIDGADFGALELATIAHELRELRGKLTQGPTPPTPGPHCTTRYCPMLGTCAATQAALASAYPLERPLRPVIADDDQARFTIERLPAARAALRAIEEALHTYAKGHPIPLGDGRVYGWREKEERSVNVDTPEREEVVRRMLGHAADFAIRKETTTTLGLLEEAVRIALGDAPARGAKAEMLRGLLAELEGAGGLRISKYEKPEAFKPKGNAA
jgi:hypothetical protein